MIDPADFREVGEALKIGQSARIPHHCGEGNTLKVTRKEAGISAFCFRCAPSKGWIPIGLSLAERIARLNAATQVEETARQSVALPKPAVYDPQMWPLAPAVWLYKAGLSNDDIERLGFYWNDRMHRVVMPVYEGDTLVFWQARGFLSGAQKYLNPVVDRHKIVYRAGSGPVLVLTEDILSACKVGKVTEAWSLLGVNLHDYILHKLAEDGREVVVALDPDPPGIAGAALVFKRLQMLGIPSRNVTPLLRADPKLLTREEITAWALKKKFMT